MANTTPMTTSHAPAVTVAPANPGIAALGRVLLGLIFLVSGIRKALAYSGTIAGFGAMGLPSPEILVPAVIAVEVIAALLLMVGWQARLAALALVAFTLAATLIAHRFWEVPPAQFTDQFNAFLKNISIIGGLLLVFALGSGNGATRIPRRTG